MIHTFEKTTLWKVFADKTDVENQGIIKKILQNTRPLLKQIVRVFPTYTNHDEEHSLKIINNIELLLGDEIKNLSASEACVLLLSSYWHDLGMIYNNSNDIINEKWFHEYCKAHSLPINQELDESMVSAYIRTYHNERLVKYLYDEDFILTKGQKSITIDGNDIINSACLVSISHNKETSDLQDFLKNIASAGNFDDFVFCAILLRLADIMDFDNDRTPTSTYRFLGLDNPITSEDKYSQKEWEKHFSNVGFGYKDNILYFKANPENPDIEYEIRKFIEIIQYEIEKCSNVFNNYCHKWRDKKFELPSKIDISGIKSINYKYGDFKFSFDNHQTLNLLTGNNIYSSPTIFIREILQNSIDASVYKERCDKIKCKPIEITDWYDRDGNYWIRFDDFGIGMDEYIILNYFTKLGKSFYESKDFDSDLDFKAISRFGIGILSCFMAADRVEISTKKDNSEAIRISIKSLYSFFVMQLENQHKKVEFFPSKNNESQKYRKDIGTSIAVKIDFNKLHRWFDIKEELLKHVFYSPIEIKYNGEKIGTTLDDLDNNPWIEKETVFELNHADDLKIKKLFNIHNMDDKFRVRIQPINLSIYSKTPKIRSQMLLIEVITPIPEINDEVKRYFKIDMPGYVGGSMELLAVKQNAYNTLNEIIKLNIYNEIKYLKSSMDSKIGHNGILIGKNFIRNMLATGVLNFTDRNIFSIAHISLTDEFRPSMNISREGDIYFDYKTLSAANLLLSKYISQSGLASKVIDCSLIYQYKSFNIEDIYEDEFLSEWKKEQIFLLEDNEYRSLIDIKDLLTISGSVKILNYPEIGHLSVSYSGKEHTREMFVEILTQVFTDGFLDKEGNYNIEKVFDNLIELKKNREYFPVGFFVKYSSELKDELQLRVRKKMRGTFGLNIEHIFSKWLYQNAELLNNKYKGIFEDIKGYFSSDFRPEEEKDRLKSLLNLIQKLEPNIIRNEVINSIRKDIAE